MQPPLPPNDLTTPPDLPQPMLTVAEMANFLRVSKMSIYRAIDTGELKAIRIGHLLRVARSEFRRYLQRMEEK